MMISAPKHYRIELVDCARGLALVAMAIYHFTWDLDFFGYLEPNTSVTGGWRLFARSIAISFLFIVGFSLYLANMQGFRPKAYLRRLSLIVAAAVAITMVTILATPESFIFFGILHHIAIASVLGMLFLKLPSLLVVACALIALLLPQFVAGGIFDHPALWWTGFSTNVRPTSDYVPLFPLFGVVLLGIAAAQLGQKTGLNGRLAALEWPSRIPVLAMIGRHSLMFYLLHQPVLISLVWLFSQVIPPPPPDYGAIFKNSCVSECTGFRDEAFCTAYCACLLENATSSGLVEQLFTPDPATTARLQQMANMCLLENTAPAD